LKGEAGELLAIRKAIDDMKPNYEGKKNALRLIGEFRQRVDDAIAVAAPSVKPVDAQYQALARERDALNQGRNILSTEKSAVLPSQLARDIAGYTPAQQAALRMGTRAEIERIMGTSIHDVNRLRSLVKSDGGWNHQKLAQIFGQAEADNVMRSLDREVAFRAAHDRLVANSQTAPRMVAEAMTKVKGPGDISPEVIAGILGLVTTGPTGGVTSALSTAAIKRAWEAFAAGGQRRLDSALSKTLQLQGGTRDAEIVRLLAKGGSQQHRLSPGTRAILDALMASSSARSQ
jgi:hypothetical protein